MSIANLKPINPDLTVYYPRNKISLTISIFAFWLLIKLVIILCHLKFAEASRLRSTGTPQTPKIHRHTFVLHHSCGHGLLTQGYVFPISL